MTFALFGVGLWTGCPMDFPPFSGEVAQDDLEVWEVEVVAEDAKVAEVTEDAKVAEDAAGKADAEATPDGEAAVETTPDAAADGDAALPGNGMFEACDETDPCQAGLNCHLGVCSSPCKNVDECESLDASLVWTCIDPMACSGTRRIFRCDPPGNAWPGGCVAEAVIPDTAACSACEGASCYEGTDCLSKICFEKRCTLECTTDSNCEPLDTVYCGTCRGIGHVWRCDKGRCVRPDPGDDDYLTPHSEKCFAKTCLVTSDGQMPWTCQNDPSDSAKRYFCMNHKAKELSGVIDYDEAMVYVHPAMAWIGTGDVSTNLGPDGYLANMGSGYAIHMFEVTAQAYLYFLQKAHPDDNSCGGGSSTKKCVDKLYSQLTQGFQDKGPWDYKPGDGWTKLSAVKGVTWWGARAYCQWFGGADLCTEAQWEKAARGGCEYHEACETPPYPWGDATPDCTRANSQVGQTCPVQDAQVGKRPAGMSVYGAHDMAGNVDEWVLEGWHPNYNSTVPLDGSEWMNGEAELGVYRGGSVSSTQASQLQSSVRNSREPDNGTLYSGFRCCAKIQGVVPAP